MNQSRRRWVLGALAALVRPAKAAAAYPVIDGPRPLAFPRDFGSHPEHRIEWWYVTGALDADGEPPLGFQITFFRLRPGIAEDNPSAFAPAQLLFAHAALADPRIARLVTDQRAARVGFGLATAGEAGTELKLFDWTLVRHGTEYVAHIPARDFVLDLRMTALAPPWPQGEQGYSRKGPQRAQASRYYSEPQLIVAGQVEHAGKRVAVTGRAWLDHEWSSEPLAPSANGWDWAGLNLDDGSAVMALVIRGGGGASVWAGGGERSAAGSAATFGAQDVRFTGLRTWRSPRTGIAYPVEMTLELPTRTLRLVPLFDDQEQDARASTGTIYWEGAVRVLERERVVGRGYLELTGYGDRLRW